MSYIVTLTPFSEELAVQQAQGQSVEEYLNALVTDTLARRAAEEPPDAGADSLSFWEQEMARRCLEPPR